MTAFKAAEDSRRLTLPQKPEDLPLELPQGFQAPQGVEIALDPNHHILGAARDFALKHGLTKDAWHDLVGLQAAMMAGDLVQINAAKDAEVQKLGPTASARKTAVDNFLTGFFGEELGKHVSQFTFTAKTVEAWEKVMQRFSSPHGSSFTHAHREPAAPSKVDDAVWEKMTYTERKDYASRHNGQAA